MTVLKYDDAIKKSRDLDHCFFSKIFCSTSIMQSFIARAQLVQDFLRGSPFTPSVYLMSKNVG